MPATLDREAIGRVRMPGALAVGAASGLVWGVVARAWMRLISDKPEFTWSGTLYIVGAATIVGLGTAVAAASRRNHWHPLHRRIATLLGAGSVVLLAAAAGAIVVPTVIIGGVALSRTTIPLSGRLGVLVPVALTALVTGGTEDLRGQVLFGVAGLLLVVGYRTRALMTILAFVPVASVVGSILFDDGSLPMWQRLAGTAIYPVLLVPLVIWFSRATAPITTE